MELEKQRRRRSCARALGELADERVVNSPEAESVDRTALAEENARLRAVLGHCPRSVAVLDEQGLLIGYNREFGKLFDGELALGGGLADLAAPEERAMLEDVIRATANEGRASALFTLSIRDAAGRPRSVELWAATLPPIGDRPLGIVVAGDDRSDQRRADIERARIANGVAAANVEGAFNMAEAALCHEVSNALSAASLVTQLLEHESRGTELAATVADLKQAMSHAVAVVERARERRRMPSFEPHTPANVRACVERVRNALHAALDAAHARFEATVPGDITTELPETELTQVLANLVANAVHAIEDAGRPGCVRVEAKRDPSGAVVVTVDDDGVGVPPSQLREIFEPYQTTRAGRGGTGLGLPIVRAIAERAGGRVEASSVREEGAMFVVTLPAPPPSSGAHA